MNECKVTSFRRASEMTAVLINSKRPGVTGWISLRRGSILSVTGMQPGDKLVAEFIPHRKIEIDCDADLSLNGDKLVRITHLFASGKPVSVDVR